ncbi:DUF5007 domain-containing protein [Sphingobacterium sp. KB22]|uniref:DUF5007 domain-containing protein n=2 Tax=Sphingobacterium hungaricum TaxID=2082723 RepID=A0A928UVW8_9SPHI|nr:DUF5007 domain-containing protein [Sphingobacterium hungaricum]
MQHIVNIRNKTYWSKSLVFGSIIALSLSSCQKMYNLPEDKDFISENINYSSKEFYPILGRTNVMGSINLDNSTLPLKFEIINSRYGDGRPATDLFQVKPTYTWIDMYDGEEKSLEEIERKRVKVDRPLLEVDSAGRFILHYTATNDLIEPRPTDSTTLTQDVRFFDLKITNSGGVRYVNDFVFIPWRQRDYEPNNDINPYTGGIAPDPLSPRDPNRRDYIIPTYMENIVGEVSNIPLVNNTLKKDVVVYIRRFEPGPGNKLRFVFLDKNQNPIDPAKFNETRWENLVHGFNMTKTAEYVQYDVAYPIPLTNYPTFYTDNGNAKAQFSYSRIGFGGTRSTSIFRLNFRIFQEGNWEIVFHFRNENPRFADEQ